jgi:AcrR family transcriptional regulator
MSPKEASTPARRNGGTASASRNEQLNEARIVEAALRVAKRVGFDRLTMRALADELGVTPMATYHYVNSKEVLLELVADALLAGDDEQPVPDLMWDEQLKRNAFALYDRLTKAPGLGTFLLERPLTPRMRDAYGRGTELFERAGLSRHDAELAHATYHTFMFGLIGMETRFRPARRRKRGGQSDEAIVVHATSKEFIDFGLNVMIEGIRERVASYR